MDIDHSRAGHPPDDGAGADADALGVLAAEAYVWGYPLLVTHRTLQSFAGFLGTNRLLWSRELAGPQSRIIVAPNRDTLYALAVVDLLDGPVALTLPDFGDRYASFQFLDGCTESFAYVGTRATGGRAGTWVVTPPGWADPVGGDVEVIAAPTPRLLVLGRIAVDDERDVADVTALGRQSRLEVWSAAGGAAGDRETVGVAAAVEGDRATQGSGPSGSGHRPSPLGAAPGAPAAVGRGGPELWDELATVLAANPPSRPGDRAALGSFGALGIAPGARPWSEPVSDAAHQALEAGVAAGRALLADAARARQQVVDGWVVDVGIGTYGDEFAVRAAVARVGWGANVPEEAVYPLSRVDADGERYDGSARYRWRFPPGGLPPVEAFWSLSVYGPDMFFVEHPAGRYTIGDRTPDLAVADDGSLEVVLSHDDPGRSAANWLPVPAGPFVLMLRLYLPGPAVVAGAYRPPPVVRLP